MLFLISFILLEHIVAIIASLLKNCNDSNKQRVMNKFVENDFEKVKIFESIDLFIKK